MTTIILGAYYWKRLAFNIGFMENWRKKILEFQNNGWIQDDFRGERFHQLPYYSMYSERHCENMPIQIY